MLPSLLLQTSNQSYLLLNLEGISLLKKPLWGEGCERAPEGLNWWWKCWGLEEEPLGLLRVPKAKVARTGVPRWKFGLEGIKEVSIPTGLFGGAVLCNIKRGVVMR